MRYTANANELSNILEFGCDDGFLKTRNMRLVVLYDNTYNSTNFNA